jgi:hypothetical protein
MALVIMTGASGSGKTAIAEAIEADDPSITVFCFDTIGVPSADVMATFGTDHQPGGAWQRAITLKWFERIAPLLTAGKTVLFEGQMRIAFIQEALTAFAIENACVLCVECDDSTRTRRLTQDNFSQNWPTKTCSAGVATCIGKPSRLVTRSLTPQTFP